MRLKPARDAADVPPVMWAVPGSYAHSVFHDRHPKLLAGLAADFPLDARQRQELARLLDESQHGDVEVVSGEDAAAWAAWGEGRYGRPWREASFLWAESYFYRRLVAAFGYFGPGPWRGVDPFGPAKAAELQSRAVDDELAALDDLDHGSQEQVRDALLSASLWGNRADLALLVNATEATGRDDKALLADDRADIWAHLKAHPGARICWVADNAGRELLPDLVLIDHLLHTEAAHVVLHVKPHPYYVSDATLADTLACLRRLVDATGAAARTGARLWQAIEAGRLTIRAHAFACAPLPYTAMPEDLREDFAAATLTVLKGDLNYRRLVGDRQWPTDTPFGSTVAYFPSPVVALRTLKSELAVGLDRSTTERLDVTDPTWRTTGTHATVQFHA